MASLPAAPSTVARMAGVNDDLLALQIDRTLDARIWAGTQVEDRVMRTISIVGRTLGDEIEKSLLNQESYDDFETRMFRRMGIGPLEADTGGPALRAINYELETETRIAWNDGIEAANQQEDTITVSEAVLDDHTTEGCWEKHGRTFDEIGARCPYHGGCRCGPKIVPNPDSSNAEWAALGREILADMAAERESGQGVQESVRELKPSRFAAFRQLQEAV